MQQLKNALTKIKHSWVNLAIGIFLIVAGVASVFVSPCSEQIASNWKEVKWVIMIGIAICFLPQIGNKSKKAGVLLIPVLFMGLSSCCSYEKCVDKYGKDTTIKKVEVPVDTQIEVKVPIPPDTVTITDTFHQIPYTPTTVESDNGRAEVTYWRDQYTHALHMRARCKADTITDTVRVTDTVFTEVPIPKIDKPRENLNWFQRAWRSVKYWFGWLMYLIATLAILKFIIKKLIKG